MNTERIRLLADTIEAHAKKKEGLRGVGFNMAMYAWQLDEMDEDDGDQYNDHVDSCGTVACIAGWAYVLAHPKVLPHQLIHRDVSGRARDYLGLTPDEACSLFIPIVDVLLRDITPRQAVRVLRHLAKTGKVDWSRRGKP